MNKHQKVDHLDLTKWKLCQFLKFNEAINLIFGYKPYDSIFNNENNLPREIIPVFRKINEDIRDFNLSVYYNNNLIDCYESAQIYIGISLDEFQFTNWWWRCYLKQEDIKEWLKTNKIKSQFFEIDMPSDTFFMENIFNKDNEFYSYKLVAAIKTWLYFNENGINNKKSPKSNILDYLKNNASDLGLIKEGDDDPKTQTLEDIAKVVNWNTQGGAPKISK